MQRRLLVICRCLAAALLVISPSACRPPERRILIRPDHSLGEGVTFMRYVSSDVERFADAMGRRCRPFSGRIQNNLMGWQSTDDNPVCTHDTLDDGLPPGILELRWRVVVPGDGNYELVPGGYGLGAWGRVASRGSEFGDYFARANIVIEARAPSCRGSWSFELAGVNVTGPMVRGAKFSGWIELPNILLRGCKGEDALEVLVCLVGSSNRGRIELDWFGFSAASDDDVNKVFALRPAPIKTIRQAQTPR